MRLFGYSGAFAARPGLDSERLQHYASTAAEAPADHPPQTDTAVMHAPHRYRAGDLSVALVGNLQPAPDERGRGANPAERVLAAYRAKGRACLSDLRGGFALAIHDHSSGTTLLAIDRMGIERLTFSASEHGIVFGTSAQSVARFPAFAAELSHQAVFDYLFMHMIPAPQTIYGGVQKLRAGTCALFANGRLTVNRYWQPSFNERREQSFDELSHGLHEGLQAAVAACEPDANTGAFLSGGLDSSTVSGKLGQFLDGRKPLRTFSIGFGVDSYNELEYARIAAQAFKAQSTEYNVTAQDIVASFRSIAAAYDEPFGNSSAVPTLFCAKLAASHGVTHLLAGDGGDELFGGNERYARQRVFQAYYRLPQWLRRKLIEPVSRLIAPESRITPLRKLRSYVDQASITLPERLETWNFVYRSDLTAMLEADFLAAIDARGPLRVMQETYEAAGADVSDLNRMLFYDWQVTLADNDLRKVGAMCALAGVKVSYPMLDERVIDLSTRVPSNLKMKGLELRSFYKEAMRGFLPQQILTKTKHGFGLPFGVWLKTEPALRELIHGLLTDLKRRRIVRADFIDSLLAQHRDGHASFYGYPIWDLAMLEAWLQAHRH